MAARRTESREGDCFCYFCDYWLPVPYKADSLRHYEVMSEMTEHEINEHGDAKWGSFP